ncbi:MAG: hypothetical protein KDA58_01465 [Planctomycetaceae bacterium]|nr:hypothetical protein [Planctomycetaceae bacterium]
MNSPIEQEAQIRNAAGWLTLANWTILEIRGPERQRFLHSFCTNDITGLTDGQMCEAFVTNVKGRILAHVFVLHQGDRLMVITVPECHASLLKHLQLYLLGLDAEIHDLTTTYTLSCLCGPKVPERWASQWPARLPCEVNLVTELRESRTLMACVDLLLPNCWLIVTPSEQQAELAAKLQAAGIDAVRSEVFDLLRIEAGFPWSGRDVTEEHLAQEAARTKQAISFRKGCYLGQEPIARLDAMGHTNRELRILQLTGEHPALTGAIVRDGDKDVGVVTSCSVSSTHRDTVALSVIRVKSAEPGASLMVAMADAAPIPAMVRWPKLVR